LTHQDNEAGDDTLMVKLEATPNLNETEIESSILTGPSSPHNSSQQTLSSLCFAELSDVEIQDEEECQSFAAKMQENLSNFLESLKKRARPARYNAVNPAGRTKRGRAQKIQEDTEALRKAGFPDIHTF
jgi:hypothetical protein